MSARVDRETTLYVSNGSTTVADLRQAFARCPRDAQVMIVRTVTGPDLIRATSVLTTVGPES